MFGGTNGRILELLLVGAAGDSVKRAVRTWMWSLGAETGCGCFHCWQHSCMTEPAGVALLITLQKIEGNVAAEAQVSVWLSLPLTFSVTDVWKQPSDWTFAVFLWLQKQTQIS